jgi:non-specific serine/threonine protein kinase/serine/threonine-protein kinase
VAEGRVLGDYRLVQRIGRGGMGEVWEAEQLSLSRRVALKFLLPERVDSKGLDFFAREARAGGKLAHPGIVAVHGTGETDGLHWIAMELVEESCDLRHSLDGFREEGELGEGYYRHVAEFIAELADAVEAAHTAGVIHRDLKPGNILVTRDDRPKLTDFGLAKLVDERSLSMAGELAGTYYYMSPEQVASKRAGLDHRTDVFSLGVVLYEMLTLVKPFEGDTSEQVASKILWEDPPSPKELRSKVPLDLAVICGKAMEKDRDRRYQTMAEFAADLRRHLANEPILAKPSGALVRLKKWVRRNPTKTVAWVGAVVAVALVAVSVLLTQNVEKSRSLAKKTQELVASNASLQEEKDRADANADLATERAEALARTNEELREKRQEAEDARAEAASERDQAEQRAEELQQVSDFQANQFSDIDLEAMGLAIRRMVLERARSVGARAGRGPEVLEAERAELERVLAGADFTGIALDVLGEQVFEGALEALKSFENQPLVQAQLLQVVADTLKELGLWERALAPQEQALEIRRRELGDEHSSTLTSTGNLGTLLQAQGKLDDAEPLFREALEAQRRTLGDEHPHTLGTINNLGRLFQAQGKLDAAEPLLREALETLRRTRGDEHPHTLVTIESLGRLLRDQGKLDAAEPLLREALETRCRTLGDEHPDTLGTINNLGLLFQAQGKFDDAEQLYREALEGCRRTLGDEHPHTLNSINNLGSLLWAQGKHDEAEPLLREALEGCRRTLGDEHVNTLRVKQSLEALIDERKEAKTPPNEQDDG